MTKTFVQGLSVLLILSIWQAANAVDREIRMGDYVWTVPLENIPDSSLMDWFRSIVGLDEESNAFRFYLGHDLITPIHDQFEFSGYQSTNAAVGAVYLVNEIESNRVRDSSRYSDLWNGTGVYSDREIFQTSVSNLVLVFEKTGYRGMFYVFSEMPYGPLPITPESFLVATCSSSSISEIKNATCSTRFLLFEDVLVEFSFGYELLNIYSSLKSIVIESLRAWVKQ